MSSDSEDLGGLGPTTPVAPKRSARAANRVAGPSSGLTSRSKGSQRNNHKPLEVADDSDVIEVDGPGTQQSGRSSKPTSRIRRAGKPESSTSTVVNGRSGSKGKGKAEPSHSKRRGDASEDLMSVDEVEVVNNNEAEDAAPPPTAHTNPPRQPARLRNGKSDNPKVQRLEQRLKIAQEQNEKLQSQLNQLVQVRESEPEKAFREISEAHEAQSKAKDILINELRTQLAKTEPFARGNKDSVLGLISRQTADREKSYLEEENTRLKQALNEELEHIEDHKQRIADLEQIEKDLRYEVKIERENAAKILRTTPVVANENRIVSGEEEPKHAAVISLYEDLTNFLVTSGSLNPPKYLQKQEWIFKCIYTLEREGVSRSLSFSLRLCWDLREEASEPVTSENQLVQSIHYEPFGLENEDQDFFNGLEFFNDKFSFTRDQLAVFFTNIKDALSKAIGLDDD